MDPFANSGINFGSSEAQAPIRFGQEPQFQGGSKQFSAGPQADSLVSNPVAETGLRQRGPDSFRKETTPMRLEDLNIPELSQLEPVGDASSPAPIGGALENTPAPNNLGAHGLSLWSPPPSDLAPAGLGGGAMALPQAAGPRDGPGDLGRWVVVFGFAPGDLVSPVRALQQLGPVTKHCNTGDTSGGGPANYLFVQFATCLDRDRAVASGNPTLLNDSVLVSVSALTPDLATRLRFLDALENQGLRASAGGLSSPLLQGPGASSDRLRGLGSPGVQPLGLPVRRSAGHARPYHIRAGAQVPLSYSEGLDRPPLEPPRRHVNICKRVMRALFGW